MKVVVRWALNRGEDVDMTRPVHSPETGCRWRLRIRPTVEDAIFPGNGGGDLDRTAAPMIALPGFASDLRLALARVTL
jgi:hypothetical protein